MTFRAPGGGQGRLTGVGDVSGRRIVLQADDWPFDGAYRKLAAGRTGRDGRFAFVVRPGRNTNLRVRFRNVPSPVATLWADRFMRVRERGGGTDSPRLIVKLYSIGRRDAARRRTVFGYVADAEGATYRLATQRRFTRKRPAYVRTVLRFPPGTLGDPQVWMVCLPERTPDAYGPPTETERLCGAPEIAPEPGVTAPG